MNSVEFHEYAKKFIDNSSGIMMNKGREYASGSIADDKNTGTEDRLGNFKRSANAVGVLPEVVGTIFMNKHLDSINTFIRNLQVSGNLASVEAGLSEPIMTRLYDAANYLLLLGALIEERRGAEMAAAFIAKQAK